MLPVRAPARFVAATSLACALLAAPAARATDPFEIQVYDGTANAPGLLTLENHVNLVARGQRDAAGPEAPTDRQLHWTFEGALGLTSFWEPGVYIQTAYVPERGIEWAGFKLRSKFVVPPDTFRYFHFGLNLELGDVPTLFDAEQWAIEVRPIASVEYGMLRASINPIVGVPLTRSEGPGFEPAALLDLVLSPRAAVGLEYYGGVGPIANPLPLAEQEHYLYFAGDFVLTKGLDLNVGVGHGFTDASDPLVFKMIVGIELARLWRPRGAP